MTSSETNPPRADSVTEGERAMHPDHLVKQRREALSAAFDRSDLASEIMLSADKATGPLHEVLSELGRSAGTLEQQNDPVLRDAVRATAGKTLDAASILTLVADSDLSPRDAREYARVYAPGISGAVNRALPV